MNARLLPRVPAPVRAILHALPDAATLHDLSGRVLDANRAAGELYGYTLEALRKHSMGSLFRGMLRERLARIIEQSRDGGGSVLQEGVIRRSDGRNVSMELHFSLVPCEDHPCLLVLARNSPGIRSTGQRSLERRYRALWDASRAGIVIRNAEGRIIDANPAAYRLFRVNRTELASLQRDGFPGWQISDEEGNVVGAGDFPGARALRERRSLGPELLCFWLPHVGVPTWFSIISMPVFQPGQERPQEVISLCREITAEHRLSALHMQTEALSRSGGFEMAIGGQTMFWTRGLYQLLELPPEFPATPDRALALFSNDSREQVQHDMEQMLAGHSPGVREYEIITARGRRRRISIAAKSVRRGDAIRALRGVVSDITTLHALRQDLQRKSITDPVTGIANRDAILDELAHELARDMAPTGPALLYVDLDRFKIINDILGAAAGDRLLASAALRLMRCVPEGARCGRFAGDEFLVVLPADVHAETPVEVAEAINDAFSEPFVNEGEEIVITASVGIARAPEAGNTASLLLRHADAAMAEAKRRGRSGWHSFTPDIARRLEHTLALESQLRVALGHGELALAYQPQVDLASGRMIAAEALLRWNHPVRGELLPLDFVPLAEATGDIVPIGAWTVREACRQLQQWRNDGLAVERVAVNVSYRQLLSDTFVESVTGALEQHGLEGCDLELELVERTLIADTPDTLEVLHALRRRGVSIVIDDFGEGYSALNYLRRLPIDGFKLSYDFLRTIPGNSADMAICEAIIRVGKALGMNIIAEGVETRAQRDFLLAAGVRHAQGYLFSPPLGPGTLPGYRHPPGD